MVEETQRLPTDQKVGSARPLLQVLWLSLHLGAVYAIVTFCTPWLAGWTRGKLLPFLQHPTSSGGLEFLFSHMFAFSFFPALLTGMVNGKFKHRVAEFVWLIPAAVLAYKLVTFPSASSVLVQNESWSAFHHYFGGGFMIPQSSNWRDFWAAVSSNGDDAIRGMDQFKFTAPFYAGVAYSLAAWIAIRTDLSRRASEALKNWEERKFGHTPQPE
jgi:hypothetical protein